MRTLFSTPIRTLGRLMLVGLLSGLFIACDDSSSSLPEVPEMSISGEPLFFSEAGGELCISFSTNRPWTARLVDNLDAEQQPWCTLSAEAGPAGSYDLIVHTESLEGDYREALLILNASAAGYELPVMQSGQPVVTTADAIEIDEASATLKGGWRYSGSISVAEFGIALREASETQYTLHPAAEQAEDGSFSVRVAELKESTDYRYAAYVLTAAGTRYEGVEQEFRTDAAPVRISIAELKAAGRRIAAGGSQTLTESQYIEGVVIASGIPADGTKALVPEEAYVMIVDADAADSGITLCFGDPADNTFAVGDKLSVRTKDGVIRHSASGAVDLHPLTIGIRTLSTGHSTTPVVIDHTKLADYESMYVRIEKTQLTRLFTDTEKYPAWSSATRWNMEVENSEVSYTLHVPAESELAPKTPASGSGSVTGIVVADDADYALRCEREADVAGLTNARFQSMLELRYLAPEFQGALCAGEEATGQLVIPYRNGDGSVIAGTLSAEVSGDPEVVGDLAVTPVADYRIGVGTGSIQLAVTGTPGAAGTVTFTLHGLDALGTQNSCTAEVTLPEKPEVGNFEAVWDMNTAKGAVSTTVSANTLPAIAVGDLVLTAAADNISATKWADLGATGWDKNTAENKLSAPVQYYLTSLKVGSGKTLALSGLDFTQRINGGDVTLSVQYALNGGAFIEIAALPLTSADAEITVNLGKIPALKTLVEGTEVALRFVPLATNASTKWAFKAKSRLALYGNAE